MVTTYAEGASPMAARSSRAGWSISTRVDHYVRCGCCFLIKSYNNFHRWPRRQPWRMAAIQLGRGYRTCV